MFTRKPMALVIGLAVAVSTTQAIAKDKIFLEEVVVTAQKRAENLQDTPIAITTFNAEAIADQGIHDVMDISMTTPNVQIVPSAGGSTSATIAIRGSVTTNPQVTLDQNVGIYVDGVFVSKNMGGLFDSTDLERIEVLRGPQGTLYGKNTVGGAINLISRKPSGEFSGKVKAGVGSHDYQEMGVSIDTAKVADMASFTITVNQRKRDGFYNNQAASDPTNSAASELKSLDATAGRIAGLFDVSSSTSILYSYDWSDKDNSGSFGQFDLPGKAKRRKTANLNGTESDESKSAGHSFTITHALSDELTLKSITAYREMDFSDINDYDGGPDFTQASGSDRYHALRDVEHEQYSQELQLIGKLGSVDFVTGLFWFKEDSFIHNNFDFSSALPGYNINNTYGGKNESVAAYGQADWHVTEQFTVTAGLRWTNEERDATVSHPDDTANMLGTSWSDAQSKSWNNLSPTLIFAYNINEHTNTYFKFSKGWKSGGFNAEPTSEAEFATHFDEEVVTSYELGLKSRLFDNRLQINSAIFTDETKDSQQSNFLNPYSQIDNAEKSSRSGFELEALMAVTSDLTVGLTYGYLDGSYDKFTVKDFNTTNGQMVVRDVTSNAAFPYASDNKVTLAADYQTSFSFGDLKAHIDYTHNGGYDVEADPVKKSETAVKSFNVLNARLALILTPSAKTGNTLEIGVWGKNLTDEEYRTNGFTFVNSDNVAAGVAPTAVAAVNYYGDPRTAGIEVTYSF